MADNKNVGHHCPTYTLTTSNHTHNPPHPAKDYRP